MPMWVICHLFHQRQKGIGHRVYWLSSKVNVTSQEKVQSVTPTYLLETQIVKLLETLSFSIHVENCWKCMLKECLILFLFNSEASQKFGPRPNQVNRINDKGGDTMFIGVPRQNFQVVLDNIYVLRFYRSVRTCIDSVSPTQVGGGSSIMDRLAHPNPILWAYECACDIHTRL